MKEMNDNLKLRAEAWGGNLEQGRNPQNPGLKTPSSDGLPFMPEMLRISCGKRLRVLTSPQDLLSSPPAITRGRSMVKEGPSILMGISRCDGQFHLRAGCS